MRVGALLSYLRPFYPTWDRQLEAQLVRRFVLPLERKLKDLSRGMQMKVALASSLVYRPKLLILDEPFTGLDPLVRDELIQGLLACSGQVTVFVSTHDLAEIESIATHVGYLDNGRLLFSERLAALLSRFREVEVILDAPAPARISWPATWLQLDVSDKRVRFVDSEFDAGLAPQRIHAAFDHVRELSFTPMSLRSIFVAVARIGVKSPISG
jgi:ABC-2 type transport system ATP-binding protein